MIFSAMTFITVFAGNIAKDCVYDPDITEGNLLTRTCRFYDDEGRKIIDPSTGYAGKTDTYEHLLNEEGRYEHISEVFLDPEGNLIMGPYRYAKLTADYILHESGPVCRWNFTPGEPENDLLLTSPSLS